MSDISVSNSAFSKIQDAVYDSKLIEGLENLGLFPKGFRVINGTVDLEGADVGSYAVLDSDGNTIYVSEGVKVLAAYAVNTGVALTGTSTLTFGLALTDGGAIVDELIATGGTGVDALQSSAPVVVGANSYLTTEVGDAENTAASVLDVTLIVVGLAFE